MSFTKTLFKFNKKTTFIKDKLTYKHTSLNDFIWFIFLIKDYLYLKNISNVNIFKIIIYFLNLLAYKYIIYFNYINYCLTKFNTYKLYSVELYKYIYVKFLNNWKKNEWRNISQKILLIKKISKTKERGKIRRYKVIVILGVKGKWFGIGSGKDYNLQNSISKASLNAFKYIYNCSLSYSMFLNNFILIGNKSRRIMLLSSKNKEVYSNSNIIRILFDFVGIYNIKSKIIKYNNINSILNLIISI